MSGEPERKIKRYCQILDRHTFNEEGELGFFAIGKWVKAVDWSGRVTEKREIVISMFVEVFKNHRSQYGTDWSTLKDAIRSDTINTNSSILRTTHGRILQELIDPIYQRLWPLKNASKVSNVRSKSIGNTMYVLYELIYRHIELIDSKINEQELSPSSTASTSHAKQENNLTGELSATHFSLDDIENMTIFYSDHQTENMEEIVMTLPIETSYEIYEEGAPLLNIISEEPRYEHNNRLAEPCIPVLNTVLEKVEKEITSKVYNSDIAKEVRRKFRASKTQPVAMQDVFQQESSSNDSDSKEINPQNNVTDDDMGENAKGSSDDEPEGEKDLKHFNF